ncbi:hypothetical protein EK904_005109 [Melospiza melodia maxima]|nr:hypothetical protein EK904_005109 [Melospiza melodia maxima]
MNGCLEEEIVMISVTFLLEMVFISAMFLSLMDMVSLTDSIYCVRLLSSVVGIYSSTLFSALTDSKDLGKEFKYEAFMISAPDIFPHLPVQLSL